MLQRNAETRSNMGLNVPDEDRHLLAKRPRPTNFDEPAPEDSSPSSADSESPKQFYDIDGVYLANHFM